MPDLLFLMGAVVSTAFIVALLLNAVRPYNYKEKVYVRKRTTINAREAVR